MSRAFTREEDAENAVSTIGERPVSPHRNLVTRRGLDLIEAELAGLQAELGRAEAAGDRQRIATISRDLRYWASRRETAELSVPDPQSDVIRFGMTVTVEAGDGRTQSWCIVGEDEADAASGSVSHVSPMARALFGRSVGDTVTVNGREFEIVAMEAG